MSAGRDEERDNYPATAAAIHWFLATSIFFLFVSSWWMLGLPLPSAEFHYRVFPFQLHKNLGLSIVIMLPVLLYLRLRYRPAAMRLDSKHAWIERLAAADHVLLYVAIVACCVSGYLSSSYSGWSTTLWWLIELPNWGREDEELNILFSDIHIWTCWALLALIAAHISGAIYHSFRNDGIVRRMLHW